MGAFAATATQVFAASSTMPTGRLWAQHRKPVTAVMPRSAASGMRPILVLNDCTVAVAVLVPLEVDPSLDRRSAAWIDGSGPIPEHLRSLMAAVPLAGHQSHRRISHVGAQCALVESARRSGWMSLLALHPTDPDAMGLHLTLFGVTWMSAEQLAVQYGLSSDDLAHHRATAEAQGARVGYLVGGTAKVFTQCSQNLFVKEFLPDHLHPPRPVEPPTSLARLLAGQFEIIQATVDAQGLPGASPRNGQIGQTALVARGKGHEHVLIPYHPGNAIHGHAAKLWSNRHASLTVTDDHALGLRVTITGRSWTTSHRVIRRSFPDLRAQVDESTGSGRRNDGRPLYWFVTRADHVTWEDGELPLYQLTDERNQGSIHAGGEGRHTKKPAYFEADGVSEYDVADQHRREAAGRPLDPDGLARAAWLEAVRPAMRAREAHLASIGGS